MSAQGDGFHDLPLTGVSDHYEIVITCFLKDDTPEERGRRPLRVGRQRPARGTWTTVSTKS
jgi:hypothetical protein